MSQTLWVVVLFVAAMASLPWLVRRIQQRHTGGGLPAGATARVLSAVAVGPQQRVVTVEVGPEHARIQLVLGVTAQHIQCLHVLQDSGASLKRPDFSEEMQRHETALATSARGDAGSLPS